MTKSKKGKGSKKVIRKAYSYTRKNGTVVRVPAKLSGGGGKIDLFKTGVSKGLGFMSRDCSDPVVAAANPRECGVKSIGSSLIKSPTTPVQSLSQPLTQPGTQPKSIEERVAALERRQSLSSPSVLGGAKGKNKNKRGQRGRKSGKKGKSC